MAPEARAAGGAGCVRAHHFSANKHKLISSAMVRLHVLSCDRCSPTRTTHKNTHVWIKHKIVCIYSRNDASQRLYYAVSCVCTIWNWYILSVRSVVCVRDGRPLWTRAVPAFVCLVWAMCLARARPLRCCRSIRDRAVHTHTHVVFCVYVCYVKWRQIAHAVGARINCSHRIAASSLDRVLVCCAAHNTRRSAAVIKTWIVRAYAEYRPSGRLPNDDNDDVGRPGWSVDRLCGV